MKMDAGHGRSRELLEQEAGDLVLFSANPGPHLRISHSSIFEVDEKRLRELVLPQISIASRTLRFTFIHPDDARSKLGHLLSLGHAAEQLEIE
jgi:hypothetical protein